MEADGISYELFLKCMRVTGVQHILTTEQRAKMVEHLWREDDSLSRSVDSSPAPDDSEVLRQTFAFISGRQESRCFY